MKHKELIQTITTAAEKLRADKDATHREQLAAVDLLTAAGHLASVPEAAPVKPATK